MAMVYELYRRKKKSLIYDNMELDELKEMLESYIGYADALIDTINYYEERCYTLESALKAIEKAHSSEKECDSCKCVINKDWHKLFEKYGVKEED